MSPSSIPTKPTSLSTSSTIHSPRNPKPHATHGSPMATIWPFSSSHACLNVVNIRDNGFILLRNEEILYEFPVQQHMYKIPYQLGNANDSPEEIKLTKLEPGDIIIPRSAGLFNNLFTHEIKDLVIKEIQKDPTPSPDMIATKIAKNATQRSINECRFTPHSKAAW
ncbi:hypothetical protein PVL29_002342 [Vitis rotundifolia]|uniref:Protein phosphatase n=1 Tax=Vitis rotundifolia TaxID=103349 RepID=A0AA39AGY3_VITRO|nr:hypothetical protein PVL29_002342 [Vitis rotundifolia]